MLRRSLAIGAVCASALLGGQLATGASAATPTTSASHHRVSYPADSLRALGARVGLRIGAAINTDQLGTDPAYTKLAGEQFSTVTPENVMKWQLVEPTRGTYDWAAADRLVAFARAHGQLVRGHNLVWHSQLPTWVSTDGGKTSPLSNAELRALLKKHVQDEVRHFKGKIWQWDVVNEAFNEDGTPRQDIWYKAFGGTSYIADAFRWAHQVDPKAELFYNDYNIEFTGPKSNGVYTFVKSLKAQHVPISGVGFQTHLDTQYPFPDLQNNLKRFAALRLDVAETEVDVRTFTNYPTAPNTPTDKLAPAAQSDYWSQALQACLAVQRCISFTAWGIGDANSWVPTTFKGEGAALLFDEQLQPKQEFAVVQQDLALASGAPHRHGKGAGRS